MSEFIDYSKVFTITITKNYKKKKKTIAKRK